MEGREVPATPGSADPLDTVDDLVASFGVGGRRLRQAIARLSETPQRSNDLVRACALPHRTVEKLVRAAGPDLAPANSGAVVLRPDRVPAYRQRFGYHQLCATEGDDPLGRLMAKHSGLVEQLASDAAAAPRAEQALDQVSATAQTAVRRALWLNATFDLAGRRLLCVGDHDLTSLAVAAVNPDTSVWVVDVDERLLSHIDGRATERELDISCLYSDLRFALPVSTFGGADLVFTDPPYTPEGVRLFLGRGLQGLCDQANGRLVMAYGFSSLHPTLGLKAQHAIQDLGLVVEAILPAFNRYHGAEAVGSASDLYTCRPTSRTWRTLDHKLARTNVSIYTHGGQSLEGGVGELATQVAEEVVAATDGGTAPPVLVGRGWPVRLSATPAVPLADLFGARAAAPRNARGPLHAAVNLTDDPGPWLLRLLLAVNAERLAVLVRNTHPDITNATAQTALREVVAAKYVLRLRRSTPTPRYAIVEARSATDGPATAHWLLNRAHGRLGNVLREALIHSSAAGPTPLTKNDARQLVAEMVPKPAWLAARLIDLPRHALAGLLAAVAPAG